MKKFARFGIPIAIGLTLIALLVLFWNPILDLLPIDQSHWDVTDQGTFYYNAKGDRVTGWADMDSSRYYLDPARDGAMHTGWLELEGNRYYLAPDGRMATLWQDLGGGRYYFGDTGVMHTGWVDTPQGRFHLTQEGTPYTGWLEEDGRRYWLDQAGRMITGWMDTEEGRYYFNGDGTLATGWLVTTEGRFHLSQAGTMTTGWLEEGGSRYYLGDDGRLVTGWLEENGKRYLADSTGAIATGWQDSEDGLRYFGTDGAMRTGWTELNGNRYYFKEDGTAAKGKLVIDEKAYYFTSTGANIILVNPWNYVPEDYTVDLTVDPGCWVDQSCADALTAMLNGCRAAGLYPMVVSAYRSQIDQQVNHANMVKSYTDRGYDYNTAYAEASKIVAIPGTSEHQLGLAVDIVDAGYRKLDHGQSNTATQKWLMEHCWEYGFILRYPEGTTEQTGIIYEPWHYRYVGVELAMELKELGICLEDYLDMLTEDNGQ